MHRPRVLLLAESCNPRWASVPLVGYNLYRTIREIADVTLVTQIRNRDALEGVLGTDAKVAYIDTESIAAPMSRIGRWLTFGRGGWTFRQAMNYLPYLYFEYLVYQRFRNDLTAGKFDLLHRITPVTPTYPSPMASWCDVPFVLGPLNGGIAWPKGTTRRRWAELEWAGYLRGGYRCLPYIRRTYRRAAAVICGSRCTMEQLPTCATGRQYLISENAVDPALFNADGRVPVDEIRPMRILYVGRLVPLKGVDLLITAVGNSTILRERAEVWIAGTGSEEPKLRAMVARLGLQRQVHFTGWVTQAQAVALYRSSSVFVFPSLKEFGGAVVLEAMACGLPCMVMDHGGPAEYVGGAEPIAAPSCPAESPFIAGGSPSLAPINDGAGLRIPVAGTVFMTSAMTSALEWLCQDPNPLRVMSKAAVRRVHGQYTWSAKGRQIARLYADILSGPPVSECLPAGVEGHCSMAPIS